MIDQIQRVNRKLQAKIYEQFDTVEDFSRAIDTDKAYVNRVVRMKAVPCYADRVVWAHALHTTPEYLWGEMGDEKKGRKVRTPIGIIEV